MDSEIEESLLTSLRQSLEKTSFNKKQIYMFEYHPIQLCCTIINFTYLSIRVCLHSIKYAISSTWTLSNNIIVTRIVRVFICRTSDCTTIVVVDGMLNNILLTK